MTEKDKQIQNVLNTLSKRLGEKPEKLKESAQSGNMSKMLNNMDKKQADKIQEILNDKQKTEEILKTPQAQALIKKLMGDK